MAVDIKTGTHAWGAPSKVLASEGGKHIYNIEISDDVDNANFVAKGDYISLDLYEQAAATTFEGLIVDIAADGNYYVEVTEPGDALFVYTVPMSPYDQKMLSDETIFYNAEGEVARAYELAVGDIIEISKEGFEGTPAVGSEITGITGTKATVGEAATMSVNPTSLEIVKGSSATATISNATGTVTAATTTANITASVEGTTVTVAAAANAAASDTVTLTDEAGNTATIAITTKDE